MHIGGSLLQKSSATNAEVRINCVIDSLLTLQETRFQAYFHNGEFFKKILSFHQLQGTLTLQRRACTKMHGRQISVTVKGLTVCYSNKSLISNKQ